MAVNFLIVVFHMFFTSMGKNVKHIEVKLFDVSKLILLYCHNPKIRCKWAGFAKDKQTYLIDVEGHFVVEDRDNVRSSLHCDAGAAHQL